MIIHLNGWPGVGKLAIGRVVAMRLGARFLDNHAIANVAFSLTDFPSPAFYATEREVRVIAYKRILDLEPGVPVVLTNVLAATPSGAETWNALTELSRSRGSKLLAATLDCDLLENARRLNTAQRREMHKLTDVGMLTDLRSKIALLEVNADRGLHLDTTRLSVEQAAAAIIDWIAQGDAVG